LAKIYNMQQSTMIFFVVRQKKFKCNNALVVIVLHKNINDGYCHSENLIEPAIRNGELCEIGCPERCLQPHKVIC